MGNATAQSCAPATNVDAVTASGTNSTAVSTPVVFNYPRQPPRDDGRLLALASLLGGFLDAILGGDAIGDAKDAEATWKSILDNIMYPRGQQELGRVDSERAKLPQFETDLLQQLADYRAKADILWPKLAPLETKINTELQVAADRAEAEFAKLPALDQVVHDSITAMSTLSDEAKAHAEALCTDDAFKALCEFTACGYVPDYEGIAARARADAELAAQSAYEDACRTANRYHTHFGQNAAFDVRLQTVQAAISGTAQARELERQFAFKTNHDIRFQHATLLEQTRLNRMNFSLKATETKQNLALRHWEAHAQLAERIDARVVEALRARWVDFASLYKDVEGRADALSELQWRMFSESAFRSLREGGEMLAAAAQAYQFLAASIRTTAKMGGAGTGGITTALTAIATLFPLFSGGCDPVNFLGFQLYGRPQDCGCATTDNITGSQTAPGE